MEAAIRTGSVAPFFTTILSRLFLKSEGRLCANFFIGFVVAMVGVALISFNGSRLELNPVGDVLAVLAAFVWACYSILTRKISSFGLFLKNGNSGTGYVMAGESVIGIKRQGLLFLPDGNLLDTGLEDILRFSVENGIVRLGIIEFPVPILKGNVEVIKSIREKLYEPEFSDLPVVDFSDLAQGCKTYDEFIEKMKDVSETELN